MKNYKPGQIVTINRNKYRIKNTGRILGCVLCKIQNKPALEEYKFCSRNLKYTYYLEKI